MSNNKLSPMPQNYKSQVDWVFGAYEGAGVGLSNGFQKDDIQNHQGARKNSKSWKGWKTDISLKKTGKGLFLICEDFGTVGLTGTNMSTEEINDIVIRDEKLDPEERLARFSSMHNSGGNETGAGLYGVGKSVYSVASEEYVYYFDSLREDGKYVANVNNAGRIHERAYEGEEAKNFIKNETGLKEKTTTGTRVIIKNPKKEILDDIDNGKMEKYIQESWWRIISRLSSDSAISLNGKPVDMPKEVFDTNKKYETENIEVYKPGYKVKHFGFYLFEDGKSEWQGISYYRKGMKIGRVDIDPKLEEKIKDKYWGYIEVEEEWESELAEIEDKVHFGVIPKRKTRVTYQNLRNYSSEKVRELLLQWGIIKDEERGDQKLKKELNKIAEEVQDLFESLEFEDLGKGPQKSDFDIRWKDIKYPNENTMTVYTGDIIEFGALFSSRYLTDKEIKYELLVKDMETQSVIHTIDSKIIKLKAGEKKEEQYRLLINNEHAQRYNENRIVLRASVQGSGKEKIKELPFFFDTEKPDTFKETVTLSLHTCEFPTEASRRVNFNEKIKNISYRIDNNREDLLKYRINVSIHNASDPNCPEIESIYTTDGEVGAFEETIINDIPDIFFDEEKYSQFLQEGVLQLRARLIALDNSGELRKGDRITHYYCDIYFNRDEKNGKRDAFNVNSVEEPDNYRRSWFEKNGNDRTIFLNVGHPAYIRIKDYEEIQYDYLSEQVLKQYILIYLSEGKYDMFEESGVRFEELDSLSAANSVIERIEHTYFKSVE